MEFHYKTIELDESATTEQIKVQYKKLQRKYHPDKNQCDTDLANMISARINNAYDTLGNPEKKAEYDKTPNSSEISLALL